MIISKTRLELEKKVAVQEVLANIIRVSNEGGVFLYDVVRYSNFEPPVTTVYEITSKVFKTMPTRDES